MSRVFRYWQIYVSTCSLCAQQKLSVWHNDYIDSYSRYVAIVTSRSCIINFMNTSIYSVHRLIVIVYMSNDIKLVYCIIINVSNIVKGLLLKGQCICIVYHVKPFKFIT